MMVEEITTIDEQWDAFVAKSEYGDILQTWEWGEIKRDELWRVHRLRVARNGTIFGQAQVLTRRMPMGLTLYYIPRGPVLDYTAPYMEEVLTKI